VRWRDVRMEKPPSASLEFFTANIRNSNTRKAYAKAAAEFSAWCDKKRIEHLRDVQPFHVAAYIEELQLRIADRYRRSGWFARPRPHRFADLYLCPRERGRSHARR
jgi:hypothetical protein